MSKPDGSRTLKFQFSFMFPMISWWCRNDWINCPKNPSMDPAMNEWMNRLFSMDDASIIHPNGQLRWRDWSQTLMGHSSMKKTMGYVFSSDCKSHSGQPTIKPNQSPFGLVNWLRTIWPPVLLLLLLLLHSSMKLVTVWFHSSATSNQNQTKSNFNQSNCIFSSCFFLFFVFLASWLIYIFFISCFSIHFIFVI